MEQEKDVSEYLQEVNFLELNNNSLWQRVEEAITQLQDIKYVVDMGTDLVNGDSCEPDAGVGVKPDSFDLIFYIQVCLFLFFCLRIVLVLNIFLPFQFFDNFTVFSNA